MIDQRVNLQALEPDRKLDLRVRRLMTASLEDAARTTRAAPFLPFEGAVYALVLAAYLVYATASAIHMLQQSHAQRPAPRVAQSSLSILG